MSVYANFCIYVCLWMSISLPVSTTFDYVYICIFANVYRSFLFYNTLNYVSITGDQLRECSHWINIYWTPIVYTVLGI